jgi:predicted nucleotidyltransferase
MWKEFYAQSTQAARTQRQRRCAEIMKTDYESGFRAVRQIYRHAIQHFPDNAGHILERYTSKLLGRFYPAWGMHRAPK